MGTLLNAVDSRSLLHANTPWGFWGVLDDGIEIADWQRASQRAAHCLADLPVEANDDPVVLMGQILGEEEFGPEHWRLSPAKRLYYQVRPMLPEGLRPLVRQLFVRRKKTGGTLGWPIEDRYVRYQFELMRQVLLGRGRSAVPYIHFWPAGKDFAFVLTHDVEGQRGHDFVRELATLEEAYGFRSSFNFVPERYQVDPRLLGELRERGFEVGVHGLKHDGKLFSSYATFARRAERINDYLHAWQAVGFRSPMTHRRPDWMQNLAVEYDSSFFDTDPFEPIPGGTMSIWPYVLGHFIELPYTLSQDHTLLVTLGETSPRLWLDKVAFIARYGGLALLNSHPDYLLVPQRLGVYESFLQEMQRLSGHWSALPRDVAEWWRRRASVGTSDDLGLLTGPSLPEPTIRALVLGQDDSLVFGQPFSLTTA